jgi:thiamine pyridinylase
VIYAKPLTAIALTLLCCLFFSFKERKQVAVKRPLVVSMYPFIPAADDYYSQLEQAYEALYPDIDLVIKLNQDYYDPIKGILKEEADVYELDCFFIKDFIALNKIKYLRSHSIVPQNLMPVANIVYQNNKLFAIPHWIRGNFLFYSIKDAGMRTANRLKNLESTIGNQPTDKSQLLVDLKDPLRIAELYLDALLDEHGKLELIKKYCGTENIDKIAFGNLKRVSLLTHSNKSVEISSDKNGFYERQFAKKSGRGLVGHSESLYYIIDEIINAGSGKQNCLSSEEISLKSWNCSDKIPSSMGSVIALALNSQLKGERLRDADIFLSYCGSGDDYRRALKPKPGEAPRYLMPPFKPYYQDTSITNYAPLYKVLYPLALRLSTFTKEGMASRLKAIGNKINKNLWN